MIFFGQMRDDLRRLSERRNNLKLLKVYICIFVENTEALHYCLGLKLSSALISVRPDTARKSTPTLAELSLEDSDCQERVFIIKIYLFVNTSIRFLSAHTES